MLINQITGLGFFQRLWFIVKLLIHPNGRKRIEVLHNCEIMFLAVKSVRRLHYIWHSGTAAQIYFGDTVFHIVSSGEANATAYGSYGKAKAVSCKYNSKAACDGDIRYLKSGRKLRVVRDKKNSPEKRWWECIVKTEGLPDLTRTARADCLFEVIGEVLDDLHLII